MKTVFATFLTAALAATLSPSTASAQAKCETWKDSEIRCSTSGKSAQFTLKNLACCPSVNFKFDIYRSRCGTPGTKAAHTGRLNRQTVVIPVNTTSVLNCGELFIYGCHSPKTPSRIEKCRLMIDAKPS